MFCCLQLINTLYRYRPTQQQEGGSDCGLFAIAFAGVLASGCHPSSFKFKQSEMREHLCQCLVASQLSDFPTAKKGRERRSAVRKSYHIQVFCSCRMPDHFSEEMIKCNQCKLWYHKDLCVFTSTTKPKQWFCSLCCAY